MILTLFLAPAETTRAEANELAVPTLEMFAGGMTDAKGKPQSRSGPAQKVGPITLQINDNNPNADSITDYPTGTTPVEVTFELSNQQYQEAKPVPGQIGGLAGVEFGQFGPYAADKMNQYGAMGDFVAQAGGNPETAVGPASFYSSALQDSANLGKGITLQNAGGKIENPNYGVQMNAYPHALNGKPAGTYHTADLTVRFNRPVTNPVLHFYELGELLSAGPVSAEFRLRSADSDTPAKFKRLSGTDQRFEVTESRVRNPNPHNGCSVPSNQPGAACGSVVVKGENMKEIKLAVYLTSATPWVVAKSSGREGGDRLGIAVSLLNPAVPPAAAASTAGPVKALAWTGFYAGFSVGVIFNDSDVDASHVALTTDPLSRSIDSTGFIPGVHGGYLHQLSSGWVVGGELDFTYPDSNGVDYAYCACPSYTFDKLSVKNRLQGSLRGRVGYTFDKLLPYLTTGVSFADVRFRYTNENGDTYDKNTAQTGWVLGGGLEYAILEQLSLRAEYLYSDYGDALSLGLPTIQEIREPAAKARGDLTSHTLRAALNYRF